MGDVTYVQTLKIVAGKSPSSAGGRIIEKDFEIDPPEVLDANNFNEDTSHRFIIEDGTIDQDLCQGTIALIKVFVIRPVTDLEVKLINTVGTSQNITFTGGRTSIIHANLTQILVSNSTGSPIKGIFFVAGD